LPRFQLHRDTVSRETSKAPTEPQPIDFERSLSELEGIVEKLEHGDLTLDESLKQFERGVELARSCQGALKQAEQKVEILLRKNGDPEEFDSASLDGTNEDEED
jgi:exodeoxyribonuclease VII small subunit